MKNAAVRFAVRVMPTRAQPPSVTFVMARFASTLPRRRTMVRRTMNSFAQSRRRSALQSAVSILNGASSRAKVIEVTGVTEQVVVDIVEAGTIRRR